MEPKKIIEVNIPKEIYFDLGPKSGSIFDKCIVFNSGNNILYLIHSFDKQIEIYDLNKKTILSKIQFDGFVKSLKHIFDEEKKRDILMIIYELIGDYYVKLYNIINFECILSLKFMNTHIAACFLRDKNEYYIAVGDSKTFYSNWNDNEYDDSHEIKVYDFKNNKIKEINDSARHTYDINTYYEYNRIYIITENHDCLRSFDYNNNMLYREYKNAEFFYGHIIQGKDLITRLIAKSDSSLIEIFNFHTGSSLMKIDVGKLNLTWLWNNGSILIFEKGHYKIIDLLNIKTSDAIFNYTDFDTGNMKRIILNETDSLLISTKDGKIDITGIKIIK